MKPRPHLSVQRTDLVLLPVIVASILAFSFTGCSKDETTAAPQPEAPTSSPAPEQAAEPSAFAPVTSREPSATAPSGDQISAPGAAFTLPEEWQSETPSSSMRLAQAKIPGDAGDGTLTVFYFGPGGGGGVDANLDRWISQLAVAPDSQPSRDAFQVGVYNVTWIEVRGTLKGGTMGGPSTDQPNSTLLGAVVEGAQGPWFFKATGPTPTLEAQRPAFLGMLKSVRSP